MVEKIRGTATITEAPPAKVIQFTVKPPATVKWTEDTKDNEGLGRKKSKGTESSSHF